MKMRSRVIVSEPGGVAASDGPHLLALVTDAYGGYGGIAQYNRDFLLVAARSGLFRSILALPRLAPQEQGALPQGLGQEKPSKGRLQYALRALVSALRNRPTIIFSGHAYHGPLALILARLTGARLVSQLHGTEVWLPLSYFARIALEASDLILTVSRDTRARTLAQLSIAPERVVVVNNTVDDAFCPGDRDSARRRFGVGEELAILTVSRLDGRVGYKGHDRIIKILPDLRHRGIAVSYLVAGVGPDRERLERLAQSLEVSDQVRFLGMVPKGDLPDVYRAADLFALPSTGEGFGIAFAEAMACGTAAIGLAVGGTPDALADGNLGICISPEEFPNALISALENCNTRNEGLPQLVQERFGPENFARVLAMHLGLLLEGDDKSRSSHLN